MKLFLPLSIFFHSILLFALWDFNGKPSEVLTITVEYRNKTSADPTTHTKQKIIGLSKGTAAVAEQSTFSQETYALNGSPVEGTALGIEVHYPRLSRTLGESGIVIVEIHNNNQGQSQTNVRTSSGYERLDQAAITAVQQALANGRLTQSLATQKQMQISFVFKLVDTGSF